ncbi:hypothetical protein [Paenibacillus elgii]|uniref:hypothetical protein n=1 Tax=Paenibacillus elgii TaxID=189691 RepID=UPI00203EDAA8|nr:hypothetical protein [Paenibacillus elgii]MCM3273991.1 hypothetical protein [Paenibacillus elgii]
MEYSDLLLAIAPIGNDSFDKEPFNDYLKRVGYLLPNIPECVFENWIYRHYSDIDDYSFLDFRKMQFEKVTWHKDKVYTEVNSYDDNHLINSLGYQIYENSYLAWLQRYMIENSTWPVPIIVFENNTHSNMGKPYHLLEGHLRTNYFRTIYKQEKERLLEYHSVWKVTIK